MKKIDLCKDWLLSMHPLTYTKEELWRVKQEGYRMAADLPCDIHTPLVREGKLPKADIAENYKDCLWVENKSWWFEKTFTVTEEMLGAERLHLVLERLDCMADIFLNDIHIGCHKSVFYPFEKNVKEYLTVGENKLYVRVTTGLEHFSRADASNILIAGCMEDTRADYRSAMLRKPQHVFGWDWCPRIPTCGITGSAYLLVMDEVRICSVHAAATEIGEQAKVKAEVELENFHISRTVNGRVTVEILRKGEAVVTAVKDTMIRSGLTYYDFELAVENPELWWPNGYGEQPLYEIKAEVTFEGKNETKAQVFGIRTVEISTAQVSELENELAFIINGKKIFAKGGNWVPQDPIYAEVTDEKIEALITAAVDLNFNMLRIWGGGLYENDTFYRLCNEKGILVWHDFMFACSTVPDRDPEYFDLVREEFYYQIKRLRNHPSIVLWCGSNECHQFFEIWNSNPEVDLDYFGGERIFNYLAPQTVRECCPEVPYWNASPYGGDYSTSNLSGDFHCWGDHALSSELEKTLSLLQYDLDISKFNSEYGFIGPCCKQSTIDYMGTEDIDRYSSAFRNHVNTSDTTFATKGTGECVIDKGIEKFYNKRDCLLDDYILYGGMVQALIYEYSIDSHRSQDFCNGNLIWMYNDCWGEAGWTPIDYYLRKKPSYYAIKRSYAPLRAALRREVNKLYLYLVNDTDETINTEFAVGYVRYDGTGRDEETVKVTAGHGVTKVELPIDLKCCELEEGTIYGVDTEGRFDKAIYQPDCYPFSVIPKTAVTVTETCVKEGNTYVTVTAEQYAHGVHLEGAEELTASDLYFDLLPGESRTIVLYDYAGEPLKLSWINK